MIAKKIIISLLMLSPLLTHSAPYVYVANNSRHVYVIDGATNSILTIIPIPTLPPSSAPPPALVASASAPELVKQFACPMATDTGATSPVAISVSVIDATLTIPALLVPIIEGFPMNSSPIDIAYTTDSNSVYITSFDGNVYSVTGITEQPDRCNSYFCIPIPFAIANGNTPNGETAYIGTQGSGIYYMPVPANSPNQISFADYSNVNIEGIAIAP